MKKDLSATMVACIEDAEKAGGELVRYPGGYWAPRGGHPIISKTCYHNSSTVNAIVARGYAEYSEHRDGARGAFPIAIRLLPQSST